MRGATVSQGQRTRARHRRLTACTSESTSGDSSATSIAKPLSAATRSMLRQDGALQTRATNGSSARSPTAIDRRRSAGGRGWPRAPGRSRTPARSAARDVDASAESAPAAAASGSRRSTRLCRPAPGSAPARGPPATGATHGQALRTPRASTPPNRRGRRQLHSASPTRPLEERRPERPLQKLDLRGDVRFRETERLGRARERAVLGGSCETPSCCRVTELAERSGRILLNPAETKPQQLGLFHPAADRLCSFETV